MKRFFTSRRFHRLNFPGALLLSLLQRTPVVRVAAAAETALVSSPIAHVLRSALAVVASLGAIDSMAGATVLTVAPSSDANGLTTTVGATVQLAFNVDPTATPPASWKVSGTIPAGLSFSGLTSPGTVNVSGNGDMLVTGSPTTSGAFTVKLTAFEGPNGSLIASQDYSYTITVNDAAGTAPSFTTQPQNQTATVGQSVTFTAAATGSPTPTYHWQKANSDIPGATNATFSISNVQLADGGNYSVTATNSVGTTQSNTVTLTVSAPGTAPTITTQPLPQSVLVGDTVTFTAAASGSPAATLQWDKDGTALQNGGRIAGATTGTLTITGATAADAGSYTAVATNSAGSATSTAVLLTVNPVPQSSLDAWLSNLSVRTTIVAGQSPLIVGLNVRGGAKNILIRGAGPALAAFGLTNTMVDPQLDLYNQNTSPASFVLTQAGWDASLATVFSSVGAFGFQTGSKDSAFVQSLNGGYTVQAPATGPGTVLVEAYDTNPSANSPRLINISARNRVGTGSDVLIEGFAITGTGTKKLLIRAVGPRLADFGVTDTLADPKLEVYNSANQMIATNDNWDASLAPLFNAVGAFGLTVGSKDAAIVVPLAAGHSYTVLVRGADGGTGEALVEAYEVP